MPPRLPIKGFSTFIAFNSCARQALGFQNRPFHLYQSRCLRLKPLPIPSIRLADKRRLHATAPRASSPKNPYDVLGVKPDATPAEKENLLRVPKLARKYHPDTNPDKGARDKFVEIQDAYDTLKDEKKRAAFDQYGSASQNPNFDPNAFAGAGGFGGFGRAGGFPGFGGSFNDGGGQPAGDLFEQLFGSFAGGGRTRSQQPMRGNDIEATVSVSFLEACKGAKKTVTITPVADCKPCAGSGLRDGVKRKKCTTCGGSGARTFVVSNGFQMSSTCDACDGAGTTVPRGGECSSCGGAGKVRVKQDVVVDIPVGAEEGMALRLPNLGDAPLSNKGPRGDLFIRLNVMPSTVFKRQGANLYYQARIPFHRALLGGIVRVPTLDGEVVVRIPSGTQQGEEMVLKGRGVSYLNSAGKGDLFVRFFLQLPRTLTKHQRALLEAYAQDIEGRPSKSQTKSTAEETKDPLATDNGEVYFTHKPPSLGARLSQRWHNIRDRIWSWLS
ncbi:hypothetical protein M413DRAFT_440091 [Hebeloma cylindrosporum]|uniref:DnaJ homolog 1, mitochondrial n=1 Tax=Hebeloma cylindrosporum TaxID=76867 RepID=A0A0C2Z581_HEBCY|nr:hypothetical protein M413DRAFT_440091 [Hebeloma cylindrosporum h7]